MEEWREDTWEEKGDEWIDGGTRYKDERGGEEEMDR